MTEFLDCFDAEGNFIKSADRKLLMQQMRQNSEEKGDCSFAVPCINLMLVDKNGDLYIVQRGDKTENPFLFDKTVGGHVNSGESFDETLIRESLEEIGIEITIAHPFDFQNLLKSTDLCEKAVARLIDFRIWLPSIRYVKEGKPWLKRVQLAAYMGRYDGVLRFVDGEALSLKKMSRASLALELQLRPNQYTHDLRWWFEQYPAFLWD
jgi:ADP-ribose pyrophosphatase YjhB (NUDIX family)